MRDDVARVEGVERVEEAKRAAAGEISGSPGTLSTPPLSTPPLPPGGPRPPRRTRPALQFQPGDLLFFSGRDLTSRVIEWATRGPSHVGIICPHAEQGSLLFESTTLCDEPCVLTGKRVRGVQAHVPDERIAGYRGTVAVARLMPAWRLSQAEVALLQDWLLHVASEPYDLRGALWSGTRLFKWTALMPYPDLGSLFCSELCAAVLMRLHRLPLENPSTYNPASLLRELRRCGTYGPPQAVPVLGATTARVSTPKRRSGGVGSREWGSGD